MADFDRLLPRRKRPASGNSSVGSALFTYAEVKDITSRALQEQEERLRAEFHAALRDRLLDDIAALFDAGFVSNWSECDGLCGHVIGPFVARHPHRRRVADEVSALTLYHSEFHDCTTRKVTVF